MQYFELKSDKKLMFNQSLIMLNALTLFHRFPYIFLASILVLFAFSQNV